MERHPKVKFLSHFPTISCNMTPHVLLKTVCKLMPAKTTPFIFIVSKLPPHLSNTSCVTSLRLSTEVDSARLATVLQENAVLRSELEILRLKCKNLIEENRRLRQASVDIVSAVL